MSHSHFFQPRFRRQLLLWTMALLVGVFGSAQAQPKVGLHAIGLEGFSDQDAQITAQIIQLAGQDTEITTAPFSFVKPDARALDLTDPNNPKGGLYIKAKMVLDSLFPTNGQNVYSHKIRLTTYLYFHDKEYSSVKSLGEKEVKLPFSPDALTRWDGKSDWTIKPKTTDKTKLSNWRADLKFFKELEWRCEQYEAQSAALQRAFPKIELAYVPFLEDVNSNGQHELGKAERVKLWAFCKKIIGYSPIRRSPNKGIDHNNPKKDPKIDSNISLELHSRGVFPPKSKQDGSLSNRFHLGSKDAWSLDGDKTIPIVAFATYEKYRAISLKNKVTALYWNAKFNADENDDYNGTPGFNRGELHPYSSYQGKAEDGKTDKFALSRDNIAASYYGLKGYSESDTSYEPIYEAFSSKPTPAPTPPIKILPEPSPTPEPTPTAVPEPTPTEVPQPTPTEVPAPKPGVQNLHVLAVRSTEIDLAWNEVNGEDHYRVERSTNGGGSWEKAEDVPADHAYHDTLTVRASTQYWLRVTAVYPGGESVPSDVVTATTPSPTLDGPTNLRVLAIRSTEVDLAWDETNGEDSYTVQVSTTGVGSWRKAEDVPANHGFKDTVSVQAAHTYWFRVLANYPDGVSEPSNVIKVTTRS